MSEISGPQGWEGRREFLCQALGGMAAFGLGLLAPGRLAHALETAPPETAHPTHPGGVSMADLTHDLFVLHVGSTFRIRTGEGEVVPMELIEATPYPRALRGARRQPFSLVFLAPPDCALPQHIYTVEHPALEAMGLFLVPIGPDADHRGMCYEAVFN